MGCRVRIFISFFMFMGLVAVVSFQAGFRIFTAKQEVSQKLILEMDR